MREYEIYVPLQDNEGRPIDSGQLQRLKRRLVEEFGGLTHFPQENEGMWKVGTVTFRDRIVILRVLADDTVGAEKFFAALKQDLKTEWHQGDVLIVAREVTAL
jgi:hypothetical protein